MRLEGKVAIVSGAASGMGAATARRFAKEGAKVVIADMLEEEGRRSPPRSRAPTARRYSCKLDVTRRGRLEDRWSMRQCSNYGKLDILVNNAGISGSAVNDMLDTDAWDRLMAVNATRRVPRHASTRCWRCSKAGGGSIVNLSSISGNAGPDDDPYGLQRVEGRGADA